MFDLERLVMKQNDIIKALIDSCEIKMIVRNCNRYLKKYSERSYKDIGNLVELVVLLYIFDMYTEAIAVCDILRNIKFTGNYTIWSQVINARFVVARILLERHNEDKSINIVDEHLSYLNPSLYQSQADMLEDIYERNVRHASTKASIISAKLLKIELLIRHSMTPGFTIKKEILDKEIVELKAELRNMIK